MKNNKKEKMQGTQLSNWKKEKLGILIAALICIVITTLIVLAIVLPLHNGWEDKYRDHLYNVSLYCLNLI